jgi:hypothetical protein
MSIRSNPQRASRKAKTSSSSSWLAMAPRSRPETVVVGEGEAAVPAFSAQPRSATIASWEAQDAYASSPAATRAPVPGEVGSAPQPKHVVRCTICQHPARELIETEFIEWRSVSSICANYSLPSRSTLYLHARAAHLFAERRRNVHLALENLIEQGDAVRPSGMSIVKAVELHARISSASSGAPRAASPEGGIPPLPEAKNSAAGMAELRSAQP